MNLNCLACNHVLTVCSLEYLQLKRWKEMHLNTHRQDFLAKSLLQVLEHRNKWKGQEFATFFWTPPWRKKPWAIFVDSTILVNGYHIYSTACYYNSSVSNLSFACSQVFLWSPIFRHLSARPQSVSGEHVSKH